LLLCIPFPRSTFACSSSTSALTSARLVELDSVLLLELRVSHPRALPGRLFTLPNSPLLCCTGESSVSLSSPLIVASSSCSSSSLAVTALDTRLA
jgi:hypothetical protein